MACLALSSVLFALPMQQDQGQKTPSQQQRVTTQQTVVVGAGTQPKRRWRNSRQKSQSRQRFKVLGRLTSSKTTMLLSININLLSKWPSR